MLSFSVKDFLFDVMIVLIFMSQDFIMLYANYYLI